MFQADKDTKKVVKKHIPSLVVFTLWCWFQDQVFTLLLGHHLDRNPINSGKHAMLRWAAPMIAKTGKGKQPLPVSLLNQTEPEARPSASKSFAVRSASGSHSTAEPKTKGVGGNVKDGSNSETHGRIWSSDVVSYDILWGRKCWKPVEGAINRIVFISPPQPQRFVLKSLQVGMMH